MVCLHFEVDDHGKEKRTKSSRSTRNKSNQPETGSQNYAVAVNATELH